MSGFKVPLASIEKRRHKALAHLDANSVISPSQLKHTAPLSLAELEKIFEGTEEILRTMDRFFTGLVGEMFFLEQGDYKVNSGLPLTALAPGGVPRACLKALPSGRDTCIALPDSYIKSGVLKSAWGVLGQIHRMATWSKG
ncbi:MAG: hypothetical protein WB630_23610 [Candidatus Acidiferrales bacterium]